MLLSTRASACAILLSYCFFFCLFYLFDSESHYAVKTDFELMILLPVTSMYGLVWLALANCLKVR